MMGKFDDKSFLTVTTADGAGLLSELAASGIAISEISEAGTLQLRISVARIDVPRVMGLCERRGEDCHVVSGDGIYWRLRGFLARPVLVIGLLVLLLLSLYLPTRVLFICVEGNERLPTNLILEYARECGIGFGASRREVRSEKMKNALLEKLPQLQWAGINTAGCVATISVTERVTEISDPECQNLCHLVAGMDGVVTSAIATSGSLLCRTGQAVKQGQVLISGYTDCGSFLRAECAEGEVYALTRRQISCAAPTLVAKKGIVTRSEKKYALVFGKNRINFYKDSGILDGTCVKMYVYHYLTLPGGFQLPIALVEEERNYYDPLPAQRPEEAVSVTLQIAADDYLMDQMVAGQIMDADRSIRIMNDSCTMAADYVCLEMIARVRQEENFAQYGENN